MNRERFFHDMTELARALIPTITDDDRAYDGCEDDAEPSMLVTVGANAGGWGYQTGDNSYTGGAYGFAEWAVVVLSRDTKSVDFADAVERELMEAYHPIFDLEEPTNI